MRQDRYFRRGLTPHYIEPMLGAHITIHQTPAMKSAVPTVRASVTLLPETKAPKFASSGTYRPHIVLGPITQRSAILDGYTLLETSVGVAFVGGPEKINPGETAEVELALVYYPYAIYDSVNTGATFTVREGPTIVGYGTVLSDPIIPPDLSRQAGEFKR